MKQMQSIVNKEDKKCDCPDCNNIISPLIFQDEMIEDFLIKTRRILLVGEINEISATHVCSQLQFLSLTKGPIYIYINGPGGSLSDGYAIIDQMILSSCPIWTIIRGQAHSMSGIIAAFGKKGHRYATPNSSIMLHSMIVQNSPESIDHHIEMITYVEEDYRRKVGILANRLKLTTKQLTELMNKTWWMSPRQAIKIGLIDKIWTPRMEQSIGKGLIK